MKKEKTLEQKIEEILRHYWWDQYNKNAYIKNCTKAMLKLFAEENLKIVIEYQIKYGDGR